MSAHHRAAATAYLDQSPMCCQEAAALQAALEAFAPGRFHVQGGSAAAPGEPKEHEIVDRTMATSGRRGSYGELLVWLGRVIMGGRPALTPRAGRWVDENGAPTATGVRAMFAATDRAAARGRR